MAWYAELDKMARAAGTRRSWHGEEEVIAADATLNLWRQAAGLDFEVEKESLYRKRGESFLELPTRVGLFRKDSGTPTRFDGSLLGSFTDGYEVVQPKTVEDFFRDFILQDERFSMDTMGTVKGGRTIWALAKFNADLANSASNVILGAKHDLHALLTTSYDGTLATRGGACATRVVCRNTLQAGAFEGSMLRIKHNVRFDHVKQAEAIEAMAKIAEGFDQYRELAETLHKIKLGHDATLEFLGRLLGVDKDANAKDISTRKRNMLVDLNDSLLVTLREPGTDEFTGWTALNAVTRFVDHARGTNADADKRLASTQFGSGAALKSNAVAALKQMALAA